MPLSPRSKCAPLVAMAAAVLAVPTNALAQAQPAQPTAQAAPQKAIELQELTVSIDKPGGARKAVKPTEVTVSVRKHDEPIRNIPFSVDVTTRAQLEEKGVTDAASALRDVTGAGNTSYGDKSSGFTSIRGVGPILSPLSQDDSSVLTFSDGAPLGLSAGLGAYLDLERVEILKGPQSVLFGRNTAGGAINLVPAKPTEATEAYLNSEIGINGQRKLEGVVSGALVPKTVLGRLAFRTYGINGYIANDAGPSLGADEGWTGRGSLLIKPSEATRWLVSFSADQNKFRPTYYIVQSDDNNLRASQTQSLDRGDSYNATSKLEHDFEAFTLTAQTSYFKKDVTFDYTVDGYLGSRMSGMPVSAFNPRQTNYITRLLDEERFTQEIRLSSRAGAAVQWLSGLAYYRDTATWNSDQKVFLYGPAAAGRDRFDGATDGRAVFGEVTVPLSQRLKWTNGARYVIEDKSFTGSYAGDGTPGTVAAFAEQGSQRFNFWTGRTSLSYEWSKDMTTYATIARGYKSGGFGSFNYGLPFGIPRTPYESSTVLSYEVGARANLSQTVSVTTALFYNDVTKEQIMTYDGASNRNANLNIDAGSYGAEMTAAWRFAPGWTVETGAGYIHSELRNVTDQFAQLQPGIRNGNQLPLTPQWSGRAALIYRDTLERMGFSGFAAATGAQEFNARFGYNFVGGRFGEAANQAWLDPSHQLSFRTGVTGGNGKWDAYVFGENLLDRRFVTMAQPYGTDLTTQQPLIGANYARGLTLGIGTTLRY